MFVFGCILRRGRAPQMSSDENTINIVRISQDQTRLQCLCLDAFYEEGGHHKWQVMKTQLAQ